MADDTAHGLLRLPSVSSLAGKSGQNANAAAQTSLTTIAQHDAKDVEQGSLAPSSGSTDRVVRSSSDAGNRLKRLSAHSRGVMHHRAADKFQQLSASYKSRSQLQREEQVVLPRWVVHPHDIWAQCWWGFILCTVLITLFVEPYSLAFAAYPGLYPLTSPDTVLQIIFMCVYAGDILLNFLVAYYDEGDLITDLRSIAVHYAQWRLWLDLATTIPFDWIVLGALGLQQSNDTLAWYISLLRLLRLGRAYRLYYWVTFLTYNQRLSLLAFTLIRNFAICFYVVHWAACGFYYIAKQSSFAETSWVGAASDWIGGATALERYIYSMYWSIITFATVGYGDFHAYSVPEAIFTIIYVFINIGVAAYIIGTITLLVVKGDEKTGAYRARLNAMEAYSSIHEIPHSLKNAMKGHLRLHFSSAESSDEAVLSVYPTTIRRRILRHLYMRALGSAWLFQGCRQKMLDAVLAASKIELYMPKVDIITEGDHVNELYIIVAGQAIGEFGRSVATTGHPEGVMLEADGTTSVHGGSTRALGIGDSVGEMAFFTETPCMETVRTLGLCRVLVLARPIYTALTRDFPISSRIIMDNLVARAKQLVEFEFSTVSSVPDDLDAMSALELKFASPEGTQSRSDGNTSSTKEPLIVDSMGLPLRTNQQQVLSNLLRVRGLANSTRARVEQEQTYEFLNACTGNLERMRVMLQQGCDVDCADYDGRTGLMLAAGSGNLQGVKMLLSAGAKVNVCDRMGTNALLEAVKENHDAIIEELQRCGARIMAPNVTIAAHLCTAVSDGNLKLLDGFIKAAVNLNAADYDRRTCLHVAAAEGHLSTVKLLVANGGDASVADRWDNTPLDEALRVGATPVVEYLESILPDSLVSAAREKHIMQQTSEMLIAASRGDLNKALKLLRRGCSPDVCDYDKRTALMVAASHNQKDMVITLLKAGANPMLIDSLGSNALLEATVTRNKDILEALRSYGATLPLTSTGLASKLCTFVLEDDLAALQVFSSAGADVNVYDYDKRTPLHIAAAEGKLTMVRALVEMGAKIDTVDRWGATPQQEAERGGAHEVVLLLQQQGAGPLSN